VKVGRWSVGADQAVPNFYVQKVDCSKEELEKDCVGIGFRNIVRTFNKRLSTETRIKI
jgi:hypothetical protein